MDASTVVALLANAGALPKTVTWRLDFGDEEQDAYGKAVDLLDSLGLIQSAVVNHVGEPYEILQCEGGLEISGPRGCLPMTEEPTPTEVLAGEVLPVVSEREAHAILTWAKAKVEARSGEGIMPGAPSETMSEKAARVLVAVLGEDGHALVAAPETSDEAADDQRITYLFGRPQPVVTQPRGEGA